MPRQNRSSRRLPTGVATLTESLNMQDAPVLPTGATCKSGMSFLELASSQSTPLETEPFYAEAFGIALQLQACDFDLYSDGHVIKPSGFEAGAIAIFDYRHGLAMSRRDSFHAVDLYIPRTAFDALAEDANAPVINELRHDPGKALQDPVARHLLFAIRPALAVGNQTSELFVDYVALALASHVAHTYGEMRVRPEKHLGKLARWQEQRAKELITANLSGNITLAELAKECDLSIRHFTRAFRGSTGMSPHVWLLQMRVDKAKEQLESSGRNLTEIALECGFADQSHMTRVFQRYQGVAPGTWRRLNQR